MRVHRRAPGAGLSDVDAVLRNLRDPQAGADMRVDIACKGRTRATSCWPWAARARHAQADHEAEAHRAVRRRGGRLRPGGFAHRLYRREDGFRAVRPPGAGSRASSRRCSKRASRLASSRSVWGRATRCAPKPGLPLYGHEMGAGRASSARQTWVWQKAALAAYVKTYKPWFIGREAFLEREKTAQGRGGALPLQR